MTRIDFYVLPDASESQRVNMACRLAEKAFKQSQKVFIHTQDETSALTLDQALWHFRADAFVPHRVHTEESNGVVTGAFHEEPVEIGCGCQPPGSYTVLINLAEVVPTFFSRFERTLEIVNQHQDTRSRGRDRYSFYQQRGYPLIHHKIGQHSTGQEERQPAEESA